ncbi:malonate decarboxylase subunit alpha [Legionella pneumophila 130b]|nr:malonate decarboxylase subunit alpha [Legionella pneumophila 130b]
MKPYDKVCLEGDNQKQADFLARCLCSVNPKKYTAYICCNRLLPYQNILTYLNEESLKKLILRLLAHNQHVWQL